MLNAVASNVETSHGIGDPEDGGDPENGGDPEDGGGPEDGGDTEDLRPGDRFGSSPPALPPLALDRLLRAVPGLVVAICCGYVLWRMRPDLLLRDTTPNGGDMGAHVWFPAYLRDHLLPQGRVAGWAPDWYAGFPAGQFYFPFPALLIVALDAVLPYNVAFKLVTALGPVALPTGAYVFARGLKVPRPGPPLFSVAAVVFVFFKGDPGSSPVATTHAFNQGIMGGTLKSTLSGEYSFTIALALALCFLGALAAALRTRRHLALPAVLLAVTVLSHLVVGIFAVVGGVVIWLLRRPLSNLGIGGAIGAVGALLTAFWTVPLVVTFGYTTNMRYERLTQYMAYLFPSYLRWAQLLAVVGIVVGVVLRRRSTLAVLAMTAVFGLVFRLWPEAHVWNLRFLPFWYLGVFLLAAVGVNEVVRGLVAGVAWLDAGSASAAPTDDARRRLVVGVTAAVLVAAVVTVTLVRVDASRKPTLQFWPDWNYSGYEDTSLPRTGTHRPKAYAEFKALLDTMRSLPPGRALWENSAAIDAYGTSDALMALPYFTDGRIASVEGLFYESAATTPYHFLMVAKLSASSSNPVRGLVYRNLSDFDLGVRQMQLFGVRYFMAFSPDVLRRADTSAALRLVSRLPDLDRAPPSGWSIYEVRDSTLVAPLALEPVVLDHPSGGTTSECYHQPRPPRGVRNPMLSAWECAAVTWFDDPGALSRLLAADGPASWQRGPTARARTERERPLPAVTVSDVRTTDHSVSFAVSQPGVPVLVKTSYFPGWEVDGARGPWRVTPNFMVVVPTRRHVTLHYARTSSEWVGIVLSVVGLFGFLALFLWRPAAARRRRSPSAHGWDEPPALR